MEDELGLPKESYMQGFAHGMVSWGEAGPSLTGCRTDLDKIILGGSIPLSIAI